MPSAAHTTETVRCIILNVSSAPFVSRADIALVEEAHARGAAVTGRQLKRWRTTGLIPGPERHWLGRGHGSVTTYPAGTADLVVTLANLPKKQRHPVHGPLVAFARGLQVSEDRLKWAQGHWLDRLELPLASQPGDVLDRAEAAAAQFLPYFAKSGTGRVMLRRARGSEESPQSLVGPALTTLFSAMQTGQAPSTEALVEFGAVAGVEEGGRKLSRLLGQPSGTGLVSEQLSAALQLFQLSRLRQTFQLADYARLCAARDLVIGLARWCQANLGPILSRSGLAAELDPRTANELVADEAFLVGMVVPLFLTIADQFGGAIEKMDFRPALAASQDPTQPTGDGGMARADRPASEDSAGSATSPRGAASD
jgi:hypothetical protein